MHTSCKAECRAALCKMLWLVKGMWAGSCRNRSIAQRHIEHGGMGKSEGNVLCVPTDPDQTKMLTLNSHPLQEVSGQSLRAGKGRPPCLVSIQNVLHAGIQLQLHIAHAQRVPAASPSIRWLCAVFRHA